MPPWLYPSFPTSCPVRFAVTNRDRPPQSSRMVARTGLRMMPTSPPSPLSFRTAGFPQYGWKMCMSDGTCLAAPRLSLLPACARERSVCHHPSCRRAALSIPALSLGESANTDTAKIGPGTAPPQGSSLRSGLFCPSPSSLNRPHPPHSQARSDFAAMRLIPSAFAVRERLSDPRVVPSFH